MAKAATRIPLARAEQLANALVDELRPGCERIQVAGSIRRKRPSIGDIEMVAIPKRSADLLGEPVGSALDPILDDLMRDGRIKRIKGGDKYKQFIVAKHGVKLDLFLTDADCWGVIFLLRTGSAAFSRKLVTSKSVGGWLPAHLRVQGGRVLDSGGKAIPAPEETDVFSVIGMTFVPPEKRE